MYKVLLYNTNKWIHIKIIKYIRNVFIVVNFLSIVFNFDNSVISRHIYISVKNQIRHNIPVHKNPWVHPLIIINIHGIDMWLWNIFMVHISIVNNNIIIKLSILVIILINLYLVHEDIVVKRYIIDKTKISFIKYEIIYFVGVRFLYKKKIINHFKIKIIMNNKKSASEKLRFLFFFKFAIFISYINSWLYIYILLKINF